MQPVCNGKNVLALSQEFCFEFLDLSEHKFQRVTRAVWDQINQKPEDCMKPRDMK